MQNGFCESFNGRMRDELLNESLFLDLDMRDQGSRTGSTITTSGVRTRRWATSRRQPMPPISPQRRIGCATPTSSADRTLLHPRPTA